MDTMPDLELPPSLVVDTPRQKFRSLVQELIRLTRRTALQHQEFDQFVASIHEKCSLGPGTYRYHYTYLMPTDIARIANIFKHCATVNYDLLPGHTDVFVTINGYSAATVRDMIGELVRCKVAFKDLVGLVDQQCRHLLVCDRVFVYAALEPSASTEEERAQLRERLLQAFTASLRT